LKISDVGGTRHADEIQPKTSKLVVHIFTTCLVVKIQYLSASNNFPPLY
jgi:hypothetical protein